MSALRIRRFLILAQKTPMFGAKLLGQIVALEAKSCGLWFATNRYKSELKISKIGAI